MKAYYENWNYV